MNSYRRAVSGLGLLALAGAVATIGLGSLSASAADHLDAPTAKSDQRIDITEMYAFRSDDGTTLILNVNPLTSPADTMTAAFSPSAIYQFNIDTNLNGRVDIAYRIKFGAVVTQSDGTVVQHYTIKRATGNAARANEWTGTTVASGVTTRYKLRPDTLGQRPLDPARLDRGRRPAFGFVLIVAFGLGMALVMGGIGLALVVARGRFDRVGATTWLGRIPPLERTAAAVFCQDSMILQAMESPRNPKRFIRPHSSPVGVRDTIWVRSPVGLESATGFGQIRSEVLVRLVFSTRATANVSLTPMELESAPKAQAGAAAEALRPHRARPEVLV